ncbi:unnamed protein product [Paramecium sonneborni]|uniref:Uncharacterized protein n=1 Tax=Paramecium sonneborni TaxID=65129 RepID=A0A8S1RF09_9CILI|nr:unnamed protein product [Paramecium sonneborni]
MKNIMRIILQLETNINKEQEQDYGSGNKIIKQCIKNNSGCGFYNKDGKKSGIWKELHPKYSEIAN